MADSNNFFKKGSTLLPSILNKEEDGMVVVSRSVCRDHRGLVVVEVLGYQRAVGFGVLGRSLV